MIDYPANPQSSWSARTRPDDTSHALSVTGRCGDPVRGGELADRPPRPQMRLDQEPTQLRRRPLTPSTP